MVLNFPKNVEKLALIHYRFQCFLMISFNSSVSLSTILFIFSLIKKVSLSLLLQVFSTFGLIHTANAVLEDRNLAHYIYLYNIFSYD